MQSHIGTLLKWVVGVFACWFIAAYFLVPSVWSLYAKSHPLFDDNPRLTRASDDHPGDPLNVALIGTQPGIEAIMKAANWYPAASLGIDSDLEIAVDSVLSRPDDDAPVSSLYLFGRKEDLAFEQPVGNNPRHRHHVRLWKTPKTNDDDQHEWIGSAVYDKRVGLSHTTGQITHVTAPDVDTERDYLMHCLEQTGELSEQYAVPNFHKELEGRNGGGDPWHTDGDLYVGVLKK